MSNFGKDLKKTTKIRMRNENLSCEECIFPIKEKFLDLKENSIEIKSYFRL